MNMYAKLKNTVVDNEIQASIRSLEYNECGLFTFEAVITVNINNNNPFDLSDSTPEIKNIIKKKKKSHA